MPDYASRYEQPALAMRAQRTINAETRHLSVSKRIGLVGPPRICEMNGFAGGTLHTLSDNLEMYNLDTTIYSSTVMTTVSTVMTTVS